MEDSNESIQQFFIEHGRVASTIPVEDISLNACSINSILRPYQMETVKWMLSRESTPASVQIGTHSIALPRGGILADEMGLGKTVEMLACIFGNVRRNIDSQKSPTKVDRHSPPRAEADAESASASLRKRRAQTAPAVSGVDSGPLLEDKNVQCRCGSDKAQGDEVTCTKCEKQQHLKCVGLSHLPANKENYLCPSCWMNETPVQSAATLIVIPETLTQRWADEIEKYASDCDLTIYWYRGVSKGYIQPTALTEYDIVLITTANLAADLDFVNPNSRTLRHVKRYQPFVTPLTCIQWWRLCIDEAQSVEGVNKVSEMAARLRTENLWAITGTPISRSLRDLYGLAVYLRMEQFVELPTLWCELISGDQSKLHLLFAHLMRRKTKHQVRDQLGLPPLTYNVRWLSFPPVEGYHYDAMQTKSQKDFLLAQNSNAAINWSQSLETADKAFVKSILAPLLTLRQACVNPDVRCSRPTLNFGKVETYDALLEKTVKKTKTDCEDLLWSYLTFVDKGARTHMRANEIVEAVTLYRKVLTEFASLADLTPDDSQYIHIMHQMLEAVRLDPTVELTDEEKQFPSKMAEIEANCVKKFRDQVELLKTLISEVSTDIENYMQTYELKEFSWWDQILSTLDFNDVTDRITDNLKRDNIKLDAAMQVKISSANRLRSAIESWLQDIEHMRSLIFEFWEGIKEEDSRKSLLMAARNCHEGTDEKKRTHAACRPMVNYETLLFYDTDQIWSRFKEIARKQTAVESILNVLLSCSRATMDSSINHTAADQQLKALSGLRSEFEWIRFIWLEWNYLLNICAGISTGDGRMDDSVPIQRGDEKYTKKMEAYRNNSAKAYSYLRKKYGSLQYLKNLDTEYKNGKEVEEMCPVCLSSLHDQRVALTCGHFTCYDCMQFMMKAAIGVEKIKCAVCRSESPTSSVTYVWGGGMSDLDVADGVGDLPVKILGITGKVLRLIKEDADVKILVFSTWEDVLISLEKAFVENKISNRKYTTSEKGITSLSAFKTKNDVNVLLLLLQSESNEGLNLAEASHIIFAEPVLNTADEEQAIGRIHRIGQERPVTVHKFIMKNSVEAKIHKMNEEFLQGSDSKESQLTLGHLRDLLETSARDWSL